MIVVAYHPVTIEADTTLECDALFSVLERLPGQMIFCFPNADAGSRQIVARARQFCRRQPAARLFVNLPVEHYFSLLATADLMIGNSSSAIMESPSFRLPAINVGRRQQGRLCAANIVTVNADAEDIATAAGRALEPAFRQGLKDLKNPYGDGRASERIATILGELPNRHTLLLKRAVA